MLIFTHPTGNANVRHAALALFRAGLLAEFWTCLNFQAPAVIERLLPGRVIGQLRRRAYPAELSTAIRTRPFHEVVRLFAPKLGLPGLVTHETGPFSVDAVYRSLGRAVARRVRTGKFRAVYAYEDGAQFSFKEARRRGVCTLYDLPIGYWRAARTLLLDGAEREPEWAATLTGNRDSSAKTDRKDAELALADVVFVASSYTRRTLSEAADFKGTVMVVPYGSPAFMPLPPLPDTPRLTAPKKKLRVLFVGSLGQRKGLSYLFAACRRVRTAVALTVIGQKPLEPCPVLDRELASVRWIPSCPHQDILAEMAAHDVFVFPSLFEGFGLVLLEALAMGLPIITTSHTAGPDLIREGAEGFIVPIRDSTAIAARLELLHREPDRLAEMSAAARRRAREFSWENYETTLATCVGRALAGAPAA
ncbi:MAG: glycosyltransferase family 4 protein [Undibacterium sp.]|nr:glycosyltransferase family 4 protein [Opitutaceae bacterium]